MQSFYHRIITSKCTTFRTKQSLLIQDLLCDQAERDAMRLMCTTKKLIMRMMYTTAMMKKNARRRIRKRVKNNNEIEHNNRSRNNNLDQKIITIIIINNNHHNNNKGIIISLDIQTRRLLHHHLRCRPTEYHKDNIQIYPKDFTTWHHNIIH